MIIKHILLITILFLAACTQKPVTESEQNSEKTKFPLAEIDSFVNKFKPEISFNEYGISSELGISEGRVQRRDYLAKILLRYDVPYSQVLQLADLAEGKFNIRRIRQGNPYKVYFDNDTSGLKPISWIYHVNPADYVAFYFGEEPRVETGSLPVERKIREASGVINSSLYHTMSDQGMHPIMVNRLSEVFAWQVDFFRIQQGDEFKVIFEEEYVNGERIGVGEIKGAVFKHRDREFYAVRFEQDGKTDYFDEAGNSLRKEFLKAPLEYTRISSGYTNSRFHPVLREYRPHHGVDYAAPTGTPIYAAGDGVVERASYSRGNGNHVRIRHNSTYSSMYLHMSRFADGIRPGVTVEQKQVIGYVGATGLATGPHLCYRFYKHGSPVNPRTIEMPPSEPVAEEYLEEYKTVRDNIINRLDKMGTMQAFTSEPVETIEPAL